MRGVAAALPASRLLHEAVHHLLLAGLVELDGELVAVDDADAAIAELLVEDAVADREGRGIAGRAGDQLALDGERSAARRTARRRGRGQRREGR